VIALGSGDPNWRAVEGWGPLPALRISPVRNPTSTLLIRQKGTRANLPVLFTLTLKANRILAARDAGTDCASLTSLPLGNLRRR